MYPQERIASLIKAYPLLQEVIELKPVTWINPNRKKIQDMPEFSIRKKDMLEATKLWERFAPYFKVAFPETASKSGILRSRSEEHTSELQSRGHLVCRLLLEKKKKK